MATITVTYTAPVYAQGSTDSCAVANVTTSVTIRLGSSGSSIPIPPAPRPDPAELLQAIRHPPPPLPAKNRRLEALTPRKIAVMVSQVVVPRRREGGIGIKNFRRKK